MKARIEWQLCLKKLKCLYFELQDHIYGQLKHRKLFTLQDKYIRTLYTNNDDNNNNNNNKIWILFAMSTYSFDELKFTSAREKRKQKENNMQKHQNLQCIIFLNSKTWLIIGMGKKKCFKMTFKGI